MRHRKTVRLAALGLAALSLQLLLTGSALPCASADQSSPGDASQAGMADMPMGGDHTPAAPHEDCEQLPTAPTCPFSAMCATAAIAATADASDASVLAQVATAAVVPALRSAPRNVDLPPPRA